MSNPPTPGFKGPRTFNPQLSTPERNPLSNGPPVDFTPKSMNMRRELGMEEESSDEKEDISVPPVLNGSAPVSAPIVNGAGDEELRKQLAEEKRIRDQAVLAAQTAELESRKAKDQLAKNQKMAKTQLAIVQAKHDDAIAKQNDRINELQYLAEDKDKMVAALQRRLKELAEKTGQAETEDRLLTSGLDQLVSHDVVDKLNATVADLRAQVAELQSQITTLSAISGGTTLPGHRVSVPTTPRNSVWSTVSTAQTPQGVSGPSTPRDEEIKNLKKQVRELEERSAVLAGQLQDADNRVSEAEARAAQAAEKASAAAGMSGATAAAPPTTTTSTADSSAASEEVVKLRAALEQMNTDGLTLKDKYKALKAQYVEVMNAKAAEDASKAANGPTANGGAPDGASTAAVAAAEERARVAEEKYSALKAQFKELNTAHEELQAEAKRKIQEYKQKLKAAEQAQAERDTSAAATGEETSALRSQLSQAQREAQSIGAERDELTERANKLEAKVTKSKDLVAQMNAEIARLNGELEGALAREAEQKANKSAMAEKERGRYEREIGALRQALQQRQAATGQLAGTVRSLSASLKSVRADSVTAKEKVAELVKRAVAAADERIQASFAGIADLQARYQREVVKRRQLYNELQEMKGNIRVYCRVRPLTADEARAGPASTAPISDESVVLRGAGGPKDKRKFDFDKVFGPNSTQRDVFEDTRPLIQSVIDGYNVCIFAYGQTGSGKTYTMEGPARDRGVNYRALQELFENLEARRQEITYEVSVSMLEIYCEKIRDLLNPKSDIDKLDVKQGKNGMTVPGLTVVGVGGVDDVGQVMEAGHGNRAVTATNINFESSRSHSVVRVEIKTTNITTGQVTTGKLTLVDLAGSERVANSGVTGQALKEAAAINTSLSCLGDVIAALSQKASFIPYRNSKLTYLLSDSLGGNSKTLMFLQVNPMADWANESKSSLEFAQRVKTVELGKATKNVDESAELRKQVKALQDELDRLKG